MNANKPFFFHFGWAIMLGLIAGLCIHLEWMKAAGIFTAATSGLLIFALSWGGFPSPESVRKRNILRIVMLVFFFHIIALLVSGGSKEAVSACKLDNAEKSMETISKAYSTLQIIKDVGSNILGFEFLAKDAKQDKSKRGKAKSDISETENKKVPRVYVVFLIFLGIPIFKILGSWGKPCLFLSLVAIALMIVVCKFWTPLGMPWHWIGVAVIVALSSTAIYLGKSKHSTPATS